jgi:hypothetical protein
MAWPRQQVVAWAPRPACMVPLPLHQPLQGPAPNWPAVGSGQGGLGTALQSWRGASPWVGAVSWVLLVVVVVVGGWCP